MSLEWISELLMGITSLCIGDDAVTLRGKGACDVLNPSTSFPGESSPPDICLEKSLCSPCRPSVTSA